MSLVQFAQIRVATNVRWTTNAVFLTAAQTQDIVVFVIKTRQGRGGTVLKSCALHGIKSDICKLLCTKESRIFYVRCFSCTKVSRNLCGDCTKTSRTSCLDCTKLSRSFGASVARYYVGFYTFAASAAAELRGKVTRKAIQAARKQVGF